MSEDILLGIDVGTTALKVGAFSAQGELLLSRSANYPLHRPREGWAEQNPLDWWEACAGAIRAVASQLPSGSISSIGVVSQANSYVFLDEELNPLAPAMIWQDQRCAEVAGRLDAQFTAADKLRIWGSPITLDASFLPARALWFSRNEPEKWARTRWVLNTKDFITARLTGRVATDRLSSVRLTDSTGARYIDEVVALVDGLAQRLPVVQEPEAPLGQVVDPDLGVGAARVATGTMDAFGEVFGSRMVERGRAMVACGTSVVVGGASDRAVPTAGIVTFPPRGELFVHAGPTQAGGDAVAWWARTRGLSVADVVAEAAEAQPGSGGVIFTPHLLGERAPVWDSRVRGSFLGLSSATTHHDMSRAVLEGVAMSARQVMTAVEAAAGIPLTSTAFTGGGARSELWTQIHADVLGRPLERLRVRDGAVLGAALLGAVGAGLYPDIETAALAAVTTERTFTPDEDSAHRLEQLYRVYTSSYQALREIHDDLHEWRSA